MRKVFWLILAVATTLLLIGCGESEEPVKLISDDGVPIYSIIRPDEAEKDVISEAIRLRADIKELTGVELPIKTDYLEAKKNEVADEFEILIGATERPESLEVMKDFDGDNDNAMYIMRVVNGKIVVAGETVHALGMALDVLLDKYLSGENELTTGLYETGSYSVSELEAQEKREKMDKLLYDHDLSVFGKPRKLTPTTEEPPILPPSEHPRLMFRADDIETIRENFGHPENQKALADHKKRASTEFDGIVDGYTLERKLSIIESKAFEYAINGDEMLGCEAVNALLNVILSFDREKDGIYYTVGGMILLTSAEVYDWCYDLLTPELREAIVGGCENLVAPYMEIGFPPDNMGYISGHGSGSPILRDWLAFAIATYDEYPDIYEFVAGRIFEQYIEPRNFYYKSGSIHQGNNYGQSTRFLADLWSAALIKRMSGELIYDESMSKVLYGQVYAIRPDGETLRMGDDFTETFSNPYNKIYWRAAFYAGNLFGDPVLRGLAKSATNGFEYTGYLSGNEHLSPAIHLIFNDPSIGTAELSTLPLTYYMGSPLGQTITRTGWDIDGSDDIQVLMRICELNGGNHDHLDSGNFQIFYKGILASESGVYDSYGTPQDYNYNKQTIAHNCLLIYDPDENTGRIVNSGGQRMPGEPKNLDDWFERFTFGKVTAHEETDTHIVLTGDITSAYTNKVSEVLRSMVFIPTGDAEMPGIFAVYDRVTSSKASFKKTFLLHMQTEPEVSGNITVITNNGGKLVNQTLLPNDAVITKVGGEGNEFSINGVNYPSTVMKYYKNSIEAGWGRVEISPADENLSDSFLNVMYVTDEGSAVEAKAELIESDSAVGARLGDYVIVFAESSERADKISFTIPGDGSVKLLVVGLAGGEYEVGGKVCTATEDGGSIWIETDAGSVDLVKK